MKKSKNITFLIIANFYCWLSRNNYVRKGSYALQNFNEQSLPLFSVKKNGFLLEQLITDFFYRNRTLGL